MLRFIYRVHRRLKKSFWLRFSDNDPFLSGDSFSKLADYSVYGMSKKSEVDKRRLSRARSLFIPGDMFENFLTEYFSKINAKVLLIGNSDQNFDNPFQVPDSVSLILCQNSTISDSKSIFTLPIGLENRRLGRAGNPKLYKDSATKVTKSNIVYVPPMSPTNVVRQTILRELEQSPNSLFHVDREYVEIRKYIKKVKSYKFILCLEGNGYENHRIWEGLYLGVFPVLLETEWSKTLKYLGLPILFINSIDDVTHELLENFQSINSDFDPKDADSLWLPFWKEWVVSHY